MHRLFPSFVLASTLVTIMVMMGGCNNYKALPDTDCPQIVANTRAVLGASIKNQTTEDMMAACYKSRPLQRGCALVAKSAADLIRCSLITD